MAWFVLAVMIMAGLGYWNWQKGQVQLNALKSSGFDVSDDLKGQPRLVVDRKNKQIALVTASGYRIIPMVSLIASDMLFDRGVQMEQDFRIELQLIASVQPAGPVYYENETLARMALDKLHAALR
ncbi:hypothetical protein [Neptunomonas antarctica]|uniref:Uncharacterized protein n=1 Tax=Neptunomonas antarctica TaxID=619304 RepID=A0A1N7MZP3_9GAMM|nr:hypothetical protein [Neptunomonas antarctica]SIS91560.1 hypothetical protein SAMN05421760_107151 [Neptunomonas antarctica]